MQLKTIITDHWRVLKTGLSDDLTKASEYTRSIFQRIGDLLILFVISIIPIVNFIALGFYSRIVRDQSASKNPPTLEGYTDLFVDGLKIFAVAIIWAIIVLIISLIVGIPFLVAAFGSFTTLNFTAGYLLVVLLPYLALVFVIAFFVGIIAFMGIVHMFKRNSFGKAFAFTEIFNVIGKIGWGRYLAFLLLYFVANGIVSLFTFGLYPLGWVISAFLSVLVSIFFIRTIGLMYDDAMNIMPTAPQPQTQIPSQPVA